jgi:hypothetical protein
VSGGALRVGAVANTFAPVPVSSVSIAAMFADDGVARNVATPVPRPDTPVLIGRPVVLVRVPEDGVPNAPPFTTGAPALPTFTARAVATPVPRPEIPVETGSPVALVKVADDGVPSAPPTMYAFDGKDEYPSEFQAVEPLPILYFDVSVSIANSRAAKTGLAAVQFAAVSPLS